MDRLTTEECRSLPMVVEQVERAADFAAESVRTDIRDSASWAIGTFKLSSPLEVIFYVWWEALKRPASFMGQIFNLFGQEQIAIGERSYRMDFVIRPLPEVSGFPRIGIELDGHDFHERTKEQVTYRNARDRDLQSAGVRVLHYSGSELMRNPLASVANAYQQAVAAYYQLTEPESKLDANRHAEITIGVILGARGK